MLELKDIVKYTSSLKLLFVEDNKDAREAAVFLLEDIFEDITLAVDGKDGIEKFKNSDIDVIITDIDMPVMNGMDMIEKIREIDQDIPIVILSALMRTEYFIQSIKLGVKGYLLKPINLDSLLDSLENIVAKIRLEAELSENMKLKERMELALTGGNTSILDWDLTNNDFYISPSWKEMLGYTDDELPNVILSWRQQVHRDDRKTLFSSLSQTKKEKKNYFENTHRLRHKNGSWIWILGRAQLLYDENGTAVRMVGTHTDITDTKELELELHQQNSIVKEHDRFLQSIVDSIDDPIMLIKEDYTVELMNSVLKGKLGNINIADIQNPKCYEISHHRSTPCDSKDHPCPLEEVLKTKETTTVVHDHYDTDGNKNYIELVATPLLDEDEKCIGIIESARNITAHIEVQEELREQKDILHYRAHYDTLTGLANRTLFDSKLEEAILRAQKNSTKIALFFIDLDKFKEINDTLGHKIGDDVLKSASKTMQKAIRKEDTISRFGGDEFTIIIENINETKIAKILAEKIVKTLKIPITFEGNKLTLSASIGISIYPDDTSETQNLLRCADIAMYRAKDRDENISYFSQDERV